MNHKRILVIGLDGATWDLIDPWIDQGYLPTLANLKSAGVSGKLRSTIQPTTAPAWASFMTGMNQGKHGLFDFVRRRHGEYSIEITNGSQILAPTIFEVASQYDRHVISVNIPYTHPPRPVNGIVIGGPFAPTVTEDLVYPSSYYDQLKKVAPGYFILPDYDHKVADPMSEYAAQLQSGIDLREKLCLHLMDSEPWDLFAVVFMATDEVQHTFWHCMNAPDESPEARYRDVIRKIYQRLDKAIENLVSQANVESDDRGTVVIVLSDHGAGPFKWMINLNRWLSDNGYLEFSHDKRGRLDQFRSNMIKRLALAYRTKLAASSRASIRDRLGMERFSRVKEEFESRLLTSRVIWDRTQAYSLGAGGNIYLNLAGREPEGVVSPDDYDLLCREISEKLMSWSAPDSGGPVVKRVYRREELYEGPYISDAPDLIIEWQDYGFWGRGSYDVASPIFEAQRHFDFSDQPLTGSHRLDGILICQGPEIRSGTNIKNARLIDLAPTLLTLMGIPPSPDMDGQLLTQMLTEEFGEEVKDLAAVLPSQSEQEEFEYTPEEAELIAEHLRSLGYL